MSSRLLPHLLCVDFETTGVEIREPKHQPISCGAIILETETLKVVDKIYLECQYHVDRFEWSPGAEAIHGLTTEHLATQPPMVDAATRLLEFIVPYFKRGDAVTLIGHNPGFDEKCLKLWMDEIGINLKLSYRKIDTFSMGFGVFGAHDSGELFRHVNVDRNAHNALEDAEATVAVLQKVRKIGQIYQALLEQQKAQKG